MAQIILENNVSSPSAPTAGKITIFSKSDGSLWIRQPDGSEEEIVVTINNTKSGPLIIEANAATEAFRVTQIGAGNVAVFEGSANPDSTPVVIDSDSRLLAGYAASKTLAGGAATVQAVIGMSSVRYSDTFGPWCEVARAYGSEAVPTPVPTSGGSIGSFIFSGYGNTAFRKGAEIVSYSDGAFTDTSSPAHIRFSTTPVGSTVPVERMRVDSNGNVAIGTSTASNRFSVRGGGSVLP